MTDQPFAPMSRTRLYVLIDAFERDIRNHIARYILAEIDEETAFAGLYDKTAAKRNDDQAATDNTPLSEYLDLREAYDLLNTHRQMLPAELAREIRELTANLDRLVGIRNRVMHSRPLLAGDTDAAQALLNQYSTGYWRQLRTTLIKLNADPTWEPASIPPATRSLTIHNLPLPEYDETGLIGRAKEASDVLQLIKRRRESVITITGEGGIGKTALALDVAYRLVDDTAKPFDMVLWTSLKSERLTATGVREITDAANDILGAIRPLGKALDPGFQGSLDDLAEALQELNVLVVLDNLETLGGLDFSQIYEALPDSVMYLITSRIGVGQYERRYPLTPLTELDSIHLLNDYVRARRLTSLSRLNIETRKQVVHRLRYNPLGIRWFVLAVEVGKDPVWLLRDQTELLEFCVRSVYDSLETLAKEVLAGLSVLARPASADELVVILDRSMDDINVGLQDLVRGSLVRRDASGAPGDLVLRVTLTETATEFIRRRVNFDRDLAQRIARRESEYRKNEERRLADAASRSLAPIVVRIDSQQDVPTAQILRKALLASQTGDYAAAFVSVEIARRLNPDFWEVDRVEAFLRASSGEFDRASQCYEIAYAKAPDEGRAVVAHFYAGHLARNMKNLPLAIEHQRYSHDYLQSAETAVALGNYLIWNREFNAGIKLIEPCTKSLNGRAQIIAINCLAEAYRRWAEFAHDEERNSINQYRRAQVGFEIAMAGIDAGISDRKLRETATDCAVTVIQGAIGARIDSAPLPDLGAWCDKLEQSLSRLGGTHSWARLVAVVERLRRLPSPPAGIARLASAIAEIERAADQVYLADKSSRLSGQVASIKTSYGFIRHPDFPNNIFFHITDVIGEIDELPGVGAIVSFRVVDSDKGPQAKSVMRVR